MSAHDRAIQLLYPEWMIRRDRAKSRAISDATSAAMEELKRVIENWRPDMTNEPLDAAASRIETGARRYWKECDAIALAGLSNEELEELQDSNFEYAIMIAKERLKRAKGNSQLRRGNV